MKIRNPKEIRKKSEGRNPNDGSRPVALSDFGFRALALLLLISSLTLPPARACSVPVFRYALERWPAAPYELIVFHRGALPAAEQGLVKRFSEEGVGTNTLTYSNIVFGRANLKHFYYLR